MKLLKILVLFLILVILKSDFGGASEYPHSALQSHSLLPTEFNDLRAKFRQHISGNEQNPENKKSHSFLQRSKTSKDEEQEFQLENLKTVITHKAKEYAKHKKLKEIAKKKLKKDRMRVIGKGSRLKVDEKKKEKYSKRKHHFPSNSVETRKENKHQHNRKKNYFRDHLSSSPHETAANQLESKRKPPKGPSFGYHYGLKASQVQGLKKDSWLHNFPTLRKNEKRV